MRVAADGARELCGLENRILMLYQRVGEYESAVSASDEGMSKVVNVALKPRRNAARVAS
jgi:hypothetical protein